MAFTEDSQRFSFLYNGLSFWSLNPAVRTERRGDGLVSEYTLPDGLKATNILREYPEFDAYEWVTWFENTGDAPSGILSEVYDCDIELPFAHDDPLRASAYIPDAEKDMKIYSPAGSVWKSDEFACNADEFFDNRYVRHIYPGNVRHYKCDGGRSSDGTAPFFNIFRQNQGVIFAIGWTGQWNCSIARSEDSVAVKTKIEDTHFRLYPGEKIRTSSFVLMRYTGDVIDSQNQWRRLVKARFSLVGSQGRPNELPLCASLWGGMSTKGMIERIETIRKNKLPFEYIWMDAGWHGASDKESPDEFEGDWWMQAGDWRVNPNHHPDGLLQVRQAIEEAGMKFILWFEPERAVRDMPAVREHPDYFLVSPDGRDVSVLLNLGNEEAWRYCFNTLSNVIETLRVDCYRQDFNFSPLKYWRAADADDRRGITEIKHIMGLYRLWDALLEKFPHLLIDNCASGGRRIDIETLRRSVPLWRSDFQCSANFPIEGTQAHHLGFGSWMPYSGTGSGREWGGSYRIRSVYAGGLTTNYCYSERSAFGENPALLDWLRQYGAEYLRVRPYFSADLYPLTDATDLKGAWLAVQYNRPGQEDGIVQVFKRASSPYTAAAFPLRGLDGCKTYVFTDADNGETFEAAGSELAACGLKIEIPGANVAKLYFYQAKKIPRNA